VTKVSLTYESSATNSGVKIYLDKRTSQKYVSLVLKHFGNLSDDHLIRLAEGAKIAKLAYDQPDDLKERYKNFVKQYPTSKPSARLLNFPDFIKAVYDELKIPHTMTFTFGAFIQTYQDRLSKIAYSNFFVSPMAQSFHYARAMYMVLPSAIAIQYAQFRMNCCFRITAVIAEVIKKENGKTVADYKTGQELQDALYKLHEAKKIEFAPFSDKWEKVLITDGSADFNNLEVAAHGCFPVEHRWLLQAFDIRLRTAPINTFETIGNTIVAPVFDAFSDKKSIQGEIVLHPGYGQNAKAPSWWDAYHGYMRIIKRCCNVYRRMAKGPSPSGKDTNQILKNYGAMKAMIK